MVTTAMTPTTVMTTVSRPVVLHFQIFEKLEFLTIYLLKNIFKFSISDMNTTYQIDKSKSDVKVNEKNTTDINGKLEYCLFCHKEHVLEFKKMTKKGITKYVLCESEFDFI